MSWLAKIAIDFQSAYRLRLSDNYAWHDAAWKAFPGRPREQRRYLSRLDYKEREEIFELLLLSHIQPVCPEWCPQDGWQLTQVKPNFLNHRNYRFDLRANPTKKIAKFDIAGNKTKNGKREALLKPDDQCAWLERKAEGGGFRVLDSPALEIDPASLNPFQISKRNKEGVHFGVRFRGALEVTDREYFEHSFYCGIGSAKAFGFGMLLIKPVII